VILDLDGVLLDSEQLWKQAQGDLVRHAGGAWHDGAAVAMMGTSSPETLRLLLGGARTPKRRPLVLSARR
jgi:beta-phosphoglucomutase-like phosphatase (HAD superfamily)